MQFAALCAVAVRVQEGRLLGQVLRADDHDPARNPGLSQADVEEYMVDGDGLVRWQDIGFEPFMDADWLLEECVRLLALPGSQG